ncbi:MAG: acetolactate synthase 3 large subunit, partial [Microvirga sp.]|nr:acetolactate synthase 3 large subunit [Microvirga sp.]
KDVQFATGSYTPPQASRAASRYHPRIDADRGRVRAAVELLASAKRPVFYTGGGVINSGPEASRLLREFVAQTGIPVTSTLMGLGAYPASGENWLGMLGMHGTYEANLAMHDCDVMLCLGARFDDRITGRLDAFSPNSRKIHVDIDPSSINKNVRVDLPIIGDVGHVLKAMLEAWRELGLKTDHSALASWKEQIARWKARNCLAYRQDGDI